MNPVSLPDMDLTLAPPEHSGGMDVQAVKCYRRPTSFITVWQLTPEEFEAVCMNGGHIALELYGDSHPVVSLYAVDPKHIQ